MKQLFSFIFVAFFFVACKKEATTPTTNAAIEQTFLGVSYGTDTAQRMDIYAPANRNNTDTKVLIMVHGGAWYTGDKTDFNQYIPDFKQRLPNYVLVNINYRLATTAGVNLFPTQENDVKAAFSFVLDKASYYHFNKDKLVILGASAGGQLALLQCYKNNPVKAKAMVDMFGPTDFVSWYNSADPNTQIGLQFLLSGTPSTNPSLYQSSSPINFVTAQSSPTLILHGAQDVVVPIAQSTALKNKLQNAGVTVKMVTYPNSGHDLAGVDLADAYNQITNFLTQYNP